MKSLFTFSLMAIASASAFVVSPSARSGGVVTSRNDAKPTKRAPQLCFMIAPASFVEPPPVQQPAVPVSKALQTSEYFSQSFALSDHNLLLLSSSSPTTARADQLPSLSTTSHFVALQERRIPTAEEVAAKKLTFNLWLWGGGFLAPLIATIFYFGPKFWTK